MSAVHPMSNPKMREAMLHLDLAHLWQRKASSPNFSFDHAMAMAAVSRREAYRLAAEARAEITGGRNG